MTKYGRTNASLLTPKRLDPYYYQPRFIEHAKRVREQFNSVICIGDMFSVKDGTHDSVTTSSKQDINFCVPFLRAQDIGSCYLREPGAYLSQEDHTNKCKRSQICHGDILLNIMASTGEACFYAETCPETANANRAVGILRAERFDLSDEQKRFLVALLSSEIGSLELTRNLKGSIQQRLNLGDIAECEIPVVNIFAQTYIGDKVRQAERLRERSKELEKQVDKIFSSIGLSQEVSFSRSDRISPKIIAGRLDHLHYRSDLLENLKQIQGFTTVKLGDSKHFANLSDGDHGNPVYGKGPIYIRASEIKGNHFSEAAAVRLDSEYAETIADSCWANLGDVVFSIVGTLGLVAVISSETEGIMSRGIAKVTPILIPAYYVKAFMRSPAFSRELLRHSVGTIQRGVYLESLSDIEIPIIEQSLIDSISLKEEAADIASLFSEKLVLAAKLLVEALIEGKITELELQEAQEALQRGDTTLDRQILSRLTRKGIPARGEKTEEPPLFPDLDALYRVLSDDDDIDEDSDWDSSPESRQRWQPPIQSSRRAAEASTPYSQDATVTLLDEEGD